MASSSVHKLIMFSGLFSLFHAAYSAAQHRSYLRITGLEFTSLPLDVICQTCDRKCIGEWLEYTAGCRRNYNYKMSDILIQGIVSLFVAMYGIMYIAGDFKEIRATVELETKTWETQRNLPSFYIFNHRGRALSPSYVPLSQSNFIDNHHQS